MAVSVDKARDVVETSATSGKPSTHAENPGAPLALSSIVKGTEFT
jgi:hypothetical protein